MKYTIIALAAISGSAFAQTLSNATASYEQPNYTAAKTLDGITASANGWAIESSPTTEGGYSSPQNITWDVAGGSAGAYTFDLVFNHGTNHVLKNYTLSYSNDNGATYNAITSYTSLSAASGASLGVDAAGLITSGKANTDTHTLVANLGSITNLRLDTPAGPGWASNTNFVLSEFSASVTPVPEPSSAALLGLGGLALILRRRK